MSHEHIGCVIVHSRDAGSPRVDIARIVPDGTHEEDHAVTRSHVAALIAEGVPVTILPADQAVSRAGQVVDSGAVDSVNRALEVLDIKYAPLPYDLRKSLRYKDFVKLTLDLYEAMSGERALEVSEERGPLNADDYYIVQAHALGIADHFSGMHFTPYDRLTREQAAVLLANVYFVRLDGYEKFDGSMRLGWSTLPPVPTGFADDGEIFDCAKSAADFMVSKGIFEVEDGNKFNPKGGVKWEDALIMAVRMLEKLK